jgi:AcrR family transcriptional regulator
MRARQPRSEATRRKIVDAAVELFNDVGYANTGLGDIVERAGLTKGALYHHFSSKEALAVAIIEEGSAILFRTFVGVCRSSAPALECMIHGVLVCVNMADSDKLVRMGTVLLRTFAKFTEASTLNYRAWVVEMGKQARRAQAEGDMRNDIDAEQAGEFIVGAMLGTELIANAVHGGYDIVGRVTATWQLMLPAIASEQSLEYLQEFVARESLRFGHESQA